MNTILTIPLNSQLDVSLEALWTQSTNPDWSLFIKSLDNSILNAKYNGSYTTLAFETEEAKMFFILKYT